MNLLLEFARANTVWMMVSIGTAWAVSGLVTAFGWVARPNFPGQILLGACLGAGAWYYSMLWGMATRDYALAFQKRREDLMPQSSELQPHRLIAVLNLLLLGAMGAAFGAAIMFVALEAGNGRPALSALIGLFPALGLHGAIAGIARRKFSSSAKHAGASWRLEQEHYRVRFQWLAVSCMALMLPFSLLFGLGLLRGDWPKISVFGLVVFAVWNAVVLAGCIFFKRMLRAGTLGCPAAGSCPPGFLPTARQFC